jgi:hypothetical protein
VFTAPENRFLRLGRHYYPWFDFVLLKIMKLV